MSAREDLGAMLNGGPAAADDQCAGLASAFGLDELGLRVVDVQIFGRGTSAVIDIRVSGDLPNGLCVIRFDRFGDVTQPAKLASELVTQTGVYRKFNGQDAGQIAAAIVRLAKHRAEAADDQASVEWGTEYLRIAPTLAVDLDDQADRWRAFSAVARLNPASHTGEDRSAEALAAASVVLEDAASRRLVRSGWFQAFVKREVGGVYSPQALVTQMERSGWKRPNSQGYIKATPVAGGRPLAFRFYVVPVDWPDPGLSQVIPHAREASPYARTYREPAITDNPRGGAA
jgi:hypothetical protein